MLSSGELYHGWREWRAELSLDGCPSRLLNLVMGLFKVKSVYLSVVANKAQVRAKKLSLDKRLRRFLDNGAVHVCEWYGLVARALLQAASSAG